MQSDIKEFTVALVGDGGVGKTAYMKRFVNGGFEQRYLPTMGMEEHIIIFPTTDGRIRFTVRDLAGQEKFRGTPSQYYEGCDVAIIMFDVTSAMTSKSITNWKNEIRTYLCDVPILVIGTKVDIRDRKVNSSTGRRYWKPHEKYEVSAKSCYNLDKPFLYLARILTGNRNLNFTTCNEDDEPLEVIPEPAKVEITINTPTVLTLNITPGSNLILNINSS